ncbi:MucR family transcriptional regulator [Novosphingobium mathurense]|uniref:Transcriptional regulator, MucR family n=1 Tax=Novosphingobium mathurense TaxID=428990 RepID=A0A1U6IYX8_9SPHN|nr:MucR family transcriptional regulator [Novosphingobium mathurense]SLK13220.1 transcriptional regulator, MucR family [Novosphingobium mathurense]
MADFDARRASLDLVTAYVNNNTLNAAQLPNLLSDVFKAITDFDHAATAPATFAAAPAPTAKSTPTPAAPAKPEVAPKAAPKTVPKAARPETSAIEAPKPAVSIAESTRDPNFIVSLITGEKFKTLKRHLRKHGLTEAEYKARYGLPADYAIVAASYSALRRKVAVGIHQDRQDTGAKSDDAASSAASDVKSAPGKAKSAPKTKQATAAKPAAKSSSVSNGEVAPKAKAGEAPAKGNADVARQAEPAAKVATTMAKKPAAKKAASKKVAPKKAPARKTAAPKALSAEAP